MSTIALFFIQSLLVVCLPYLVWRGFRLRNHIPLVVLQILLGILLGPTVLGQFSPELWQTLFTKESLTALSGLAWMAGVLFAFLTGLHLQPTEFQGLGRSFLVITLSAIFIPTFLGILTGLWIAHYHPGEVGAAATPWLFAMAIGICIGVTALPVLGAILRENGLLHHRIGRLSLGIAAINDAVLWFLLAFLLLELPHLTKDLLGTLWMPVVSLAYLGFMLFPVRQMLLHRIGAREQLSESGLILVCTTIFASAFVAEFCGLHAILGGFVAGIIVPRQVARSIIIQLESVTVVILLPFFFTRTGLTTYFDPFSSSLLEIFLITTFSSMVGKFCGTALPARWLGEEWPVALALGALMQTKGMMEVVVLTILLDAQVISDTCFSGLLFMAITTTALTTPLLSLTRRSARGTLPAHPSV